MSETKSDQASKPAGQTPKVADKGDDAISQARKSWRHWLPEWMRQMPYVHVPEPDPKWSLIDLNTLEATIDETAKGLKLQKP